MDPGTLALELGFIIALALFNGVLSMSEMAMVSARKIRLQQAAKEGSSGAKAALKLLEEPSRFLAAIQIGITLIGVFAGAFGGANMAEKLGNFLSQFPLLAPYASSIGLGSVVLLVTLLSLILGELVPKRLALGYAEGLAILMARPITWLAFISRPAVHFLSAMTEGILKLFRYQQPKDPPVTDDEVKILIEQGRQAGVFEKEEETIFKRTLKLSDRSVSEVMTQRLHLVCLNIDEPIAGLMEKISQSIHSYFPVYKGNIDEIVGVVSIKHLFSLTSRNLPVDLKSIMQEPVFIPESMAALKLLGKFKSTGKHFAVVIDEYGGLSGVVTVIDLLESIVGDLPSEHDKESHGAFEREDGSWLTDGILSLERLSEFVPVPERGFFEDDFQTLGGFIMGELGHIPQVGEKVMWKGWYFEVMDMDGNRVDKVLIYPPRGR
ncbi:hemolysin family protein [Oligoflexus tunisiensis]|uniref:hemolysin family protein n=1 Tax=Oligoflexus tunisiensis TaxID=708132 RepID=UPI000A61E260|nr:hemolysin family protein [Oligoflexus tunisiensis]